MQAEDGGLHHVVKLLILHGLTQGDAPEREEGGQGEAAVYLLVEVAGHEHSVLLLAQKKGIARGIADEEGQKDAARQDKDEGNPREKTGQAKRQPLVVDVFFRHSGSSEAR